MQSFSEPYSAQNLPPLLLRLMNSPTTPPPVEYRPEEIKPLGAETRSENFELFDAVNVGEALALYSTVRELKPSHSAEIGFCCAGSGMAILQALSDNGKDATHHVWDPFQTSYAKKAGLRNVELAGLTRFLDFHQEFPEESFSSLPRIQFAFIDASHLFDLSMLDFILVDKKLEVGGIVGFHDLWMPSLQKLVRFILQNRQYEIHRFDTGTPSPPSARAIFKRRLAGLLQRIPQATSIFSQEVLKPWSEFGFSNMVFLKKTAEDRRDWRHFELF